MLSVEKEMMGNSVPVESQGAQAAPEQDPGAQSLTEQDRGAQSLAEQDRGAQSLAEQDRGAQSLGEQDQSAPHGPEAESANMSGAEPEDGAASGQEVSSPEGSGGYAAHAASPNIPASVPSLGSGRYRPPEDSPVAEVPAQPVVIADDDADAWGPWRAQDVASSEARAPDVASSEARAPAAASSEAQDVRDVKRPRRGIPAGSRARVGAVPAPNESEEDLLKQVFLRELEVRRQEGEALGLRLRAEADEPLPLLSHFYGPPSPSEMYDSLALALTDRSFLTRVALDGGSSQDPVGGGTGITGKGRLDRPEEFAEETPYMPPRPPRFPEQEQQRPQQKLLIDQATITDNALEEWHAWLKLAQQGRSLREWGLISSDVVTAVQYLGEAPPQEEPARGGRWSNAPRGGRKKQQQQEYPTSVGTLLYLKKALKCIDCFDRSPSGYRGLLLGPSSAMALERPDGATASDEREAWKYLVASIATRVQRLLDKKRAKNRMVDAMTAIWLQTPKAAAAKPRPVQPRTPTTPAEESSDSSSEGVSEVSGESQLEGEGVAESIGVLRSLGTETLWQPGVITRVFGTPALPHRVFPEAAAAAVGEKSAGAAASSDTAAGTTAAISAMAPPTPAATEPKSPASLASVIYRPGRLVEKTLLASDGSTVPLPPGVPPRHVLPQPPPPPSKSSPAPPSQSPPVPAQGQTQQEREFTLPAPLGAASSAPLGATASGTGTQFGDYESVVEAARAAIESASRDL